MATHVVNRGMCSDQELMANALDSILAQGRKEQYDTLYDFGDMCLQFGWVLMLSVLFPWAAVICLFNNVLEVHGDAFNLIQNTQRCIPVVSIILLHHVNCWCRYARILVFGASAYRGKVGCAHYWLQ